MRFTGFIGPSYTQRSVNVDCQRCVNLFPELDEMGTGKEREVAALVGTPGLLLLSTIGSGPIRGSWVAANDTLYIVSGSTLYSVSSSWAPTSLGTLLTSTGRVSMCDDGYNLVIVDGTYCYDYNFSGNTFSQIINDNFYAADVVTYQDSYFIFNRSGTNQFFISALPSGVATDPITFNADIASKEGSPDNIVSVLSIHRELWLLGERTTEVWYDSGDNNFPFAYIQGAFLQQGCAAKFSVVTIDNSLFWLGKNAEGQGVVYMANGYVPQRISTYPIEWSLAQLGDLSGAYAYSYQDSGHSFYVLTVPSASSTWVFDMTTNLWHERTYLNNGVQQIHRSANHAFAYNTHVVGDYQNGNIYSLNDTTYLDNGSAIQRIRAAPHFTNDLKRVCHNSFQLDIESGVGLDGIQQGTNPQAVLQFSDDGGHTWSNEKWTSMGLIGQTKFRAIWRRLGMSRDRVYRVTITDPVKPVLIGATLDIEGEAA